MSDRLHEDAPRFVRQRLLALEEERFEDAALLKEFILTEFGLQIADVETESLPHHFRELWQIPERHKRVSIMLNYGREPVWRIPLATPQALPEEYEGLPLTEIPDEYLSFGPGPYETPLALLPGDPITGESAVGRNAPVHLRPRLEESGPLPDDIAAAIRPWGA